MSDPTAPPTTIGATSTTATATTSTSVATTSTVPPTPYCGPANIKVPATQVTENGRLPYPGESAWVQINAYNGGPGPCQVDRVFQELRVTDSNGQLVFVETFDVPVAHRTVSDVPGYSDIVGDANIRWDTSCTRPRSEFAKTTCVPVVGPGTFTATVNILGAVSAPVTMIIDPEPPSSSP